MKTASEILLIFDIDGTLTYSDGATGRAFGAAFEKLTGINVGPGVKRPFGMTDPQIFRYMLNHAGIKINNFDSMFQEFETLFVPLMRQELANAKAARLLAGVRDLLELLSKDHRFAMALGTGNMEISGREKLKLHNADHFFPVGGFGSDAEDRSEVLKVAWQRSREHWNIEFPLTQTWIIGDTPKDVAAGKTLGAKTLAVASGVYTIEDLKQAQPDALLDTLENRQVFLNIVLNSRPY